MVSNAFARGCAVAVSVTALTAATGAGCGKSARSSATEAGDAGAGFGAAGSSGAHAGRGAAGHSPSGGMTGSAGISMIGGHSGAAGGGDDAGGVGMEGGTAGKGGTAGEGDHGAVNGTGGSSSGASGSGGDGGSPVDGIGCEPPPTKHGCFEPCGGDPSGVWLIEETCLDGSEAAEYCPGGFFTGTSVENELKLHIVEGRQFEVGGTDRWDIRANLPHECLGIDRASPCASAELYIEPLIMSFVNGLPCKESACGTCECGGPLFGGYYYASGSVEVGATTLKLNTEEMPYCVQGDTLWLGGRGTDGEPKASYKFRKRSCTGPTCGELTEEQCRLTSCRSNSSGCEGTGSPCSHDYCDADLGCSWGPPEAHCGSPIGEVIAGCDALSVEDCHSLRGCVIDW